MSVPTQETADTALVPAKADAGLVAAVPATTESSVETDGLTAEVVLVTRNSLTDLVRSLPQIQAAAAAAEADLLFVDLGSTDGTQSFAAKHAPGARGVW